MAPRSQTIADSLVEQHPGLAAVDNWNVTLKDRMACLKRAETCVSDAVQQLDELGRTHRMAAAYMRKHWQGRMGKRWLRSLPVIKTRPDVTLRTKVKDEYTASGIHKRSEKFDLRGGNTIGKLNPWAGLKLNKNYKIKEL